MASVASAPEEKIDIELFIPDDSVFTESMPVTMIETASLFLKNTVSEVNGGHTVNIDILPVLARHVKTTGKKGKKKGGLKSIEKVISLVEDYINGIYYHDGTKNLAVPKSELGGNKLNKVRKIISDVLDFLLIDTKLAQNFSISHDDTNKESAAMFFAAADLVDSSKRGSDEKEYQLDEKEYQLDEKQDEEYSTHKSKGDHRQELSTQKEWESRAYSDEDSDEG